MTTTARLLAIISIVATLLTTSFSFAQETVDLDTSWESDDIVIRLSTESQLEPIYLHIIFDELSGLSSGYVDQLAEVLKFDLNNNGKTQTLPDTNDRKALAHLESFDKPFDTSLWKDLGTRYVVRAIIRDKKLSAKTLFVKNNTSKLVKDVPLTGNIDNDRRSIHNVADIIHKIFFSTEGIASTRILYSMRSKDSQNESFKWTSEIWECDYDGANKQQLTHLQGYAITPIYVPPKSGHPSGSFFFVSYLVGEPKIFTASLRDGVGHRFSYLRGNQLMPTITLQRDKIAFISDVTGNADLFLQDFNPDTGPIGKPYQIFAARRGTQASPTFSSDGKRIAFVSNKDGSPRIYVMDVPRPGMKLKDISTTLISKENHENTCPAWSPDNTKIAYSAKTNGVRQIWVYNFNTEQETQLTQGPSHKENPSWAPNSHHLIFNSSTPFSSELYIVNMNQLKSVKITSGNGEKRFPSWEPILKENV